MELLSPLHPEQGPGTIICPHPQQGALTWVSVCSVSSLAQGFSSKNTAGPFTSSLDHESFRTQKT